MGPWAETSTRPHSAPTVLAWRDTHARPGPTGIRAQSPNTDGSYLLIELRDVTVAYPGTPSPAVEAVSCRFPDASVTALVGASGSGKTTVLRTVNRMVTPTSGTVEVDGRDVADLDAVELRRSIGYVIQGSGLLPHRTVEANILTVPKLTGTEPAHGVEELARMVELPVDLLRRYPGELSGGQAQRVGVARALAHDPHILLMDEPFGAVDPVVRRSLQDLLAELQSRLRKTVVLVTHDMSEAFRLADRILLLSAGGRIEQEGTAEELLTAPASDHVRAFVGADARRLHLDDAGRVVRDARGRVIGTLDGGGRP